MKKNSKILIISSCIAFFIISLCLALFFGHTNLCIQDILDFITGKNTDNVQILQLLRIPRVAKAIIAGSCLAISGMFMQTITKNPLVEPYITGVSSGAGIALVIAILFGLNPAHYSFFAFIGALISSSIVITFTGWNKFSLVKLILVGLAINIFAGSVISAIILTHSEKTFSMMMILSGNLSSSVFVSKSVFIAYFFAMLACVFMLPKLNFLRLDNNIVNALNTNTNGYYIFFIILSSLLAALSVCAAGILGFVGILIPHISKLLIGQDFRWLFFVNILLGSSIVLFSDFMARSLIYPSEIPLGLILAFVGAPIFICFLVFKGSKLYA
ncbi:MAG: iron ABC transporter permease [bacterium]